MNMQRADVLKAALELPADERERLAEELWASLDDGSEAELEEAWANEIVRRVEEADAGAVQSQPWPEVRSEALDTIRRARGR